MLQFSGVSHFEFKSWATNFQNIARGDIIVFGSGVLSGLNGHAALVTSVPSNLSGQNIGDIIVDQVPNINREPETGIKLSAVISIQGQPAGYHKGYGLSDADTKTLTFKNSFGGGNILVGPDKFGDLYAIPNGSSKDYFVGATVTIKAIDNQVYQGIRRRYQEWADDDDEPIQRDVQVTGNATYEARFLNEYDITFRNKYSGVSGNPGIIKVNSTTKNSPHVEKVMEPNSVTVQANWHVHNGIEYTFKKWLEDGSTSAQRTFVPTTNKTYTATYTGKPRAMTYYNLRVNTTPGQNITLSWNVHPNSNVTQYQVWRKVRPQGGSEGPPQLKATLSRNTTSWVDNEYVITDGYTDDLVWYDVRAYYSTEATYADPNYINAFGETNTMVRAAEDAEDISPLPEGYVISAFPNPFNPTTTLRFQIEEESVVSLIIFDIQGRRVKTLLENKKSAGVYDIVWSGVNNQNQRVASGVYFYRFTAIPANGKERFFRSGKLVLAK